MRSRPVLLLAALVAALTLAIAGCGGDDDETTTGASGASGATGAGGAPLSKSEFIAQADAACKSGNEALDKSGQKLFSDGSPSTEEITQYVDQSFVPTIEGELDAIRSLTPPEGDEETIDDILQAAQTSVENVKDDPSLLESGNPFKEADDLANQYGLKVCGQG